MSEIGKALQALAPLRDPKGPLPAGLRVQAEGIGRRLERLQRRVEKWREWLKGQEAGTATGGQEGKLKEA